MAMAYGMGHGMAWGMAWSMTLIECRLLWVFITLLGFLLTNDGSLYIVCSDRWYGFLDASMDGL
jgi:hypothetical protein